MKPYLLFWALLTAFSVSAQQPGIEKRDTIYGVALVLDTIPLEIKMIGEKAYVVKNMLTTSVWEAYGIARYLLIDNSMGNARPSVNDVRYYRLEDCTEIPISRIFHFKKL